MRLIPLPTGPLLLLPFVLPARFEIGYAGQGADRIRLTTGRDLELGPAHTSGPLNHFVHPHVERAGKPWKGPVEKTFRFENVPGEEVASP